MTNHHIDQQQHHQPQQHMQTAQGQMLHHNHNHHLNLNHSHHNHHHSQQQQQQHSNNQHTDQMQDINQRSQQHLIQRHHQMQHQSLQGSPSTMNQSQGTGVNKHQVHPQQQQQQQLLHNQMGLQMLNGQHNNGFIGANSNQQPQQATTSGLNGLHNQHQQQVKKELPANGKKTKGRVRIKMEFIHNKLRRYTTFSKRKTGIMKKVSF